MNLTNDPSLSAWLPVSSESDFPIQNLPYGVFRRPGASPAVGVAIGELVLDLAALHDAGVFRATTIADDNVFARATLNDFMAKGRAVWREVRDRISQLLRADCAELRDRGILRDRILIRQREVEMLMPAEVGDYIDFYTSREHANNVGMLFRGPQHPFSPNFRHMPIGYHGRTASLVVSPHDVRRPGGQIRPNPESGPIFSPSRALDFELEVAFFVGVGNGEGAPIPIARARKHIFGAVLLNDWSARDIQVWESQPLGPFLGKSFATLISPWVVPLEALDPFRVAAPTQDPPVLPYLRCNGDQAYNIQLEAWLQSEKMTEPLRITSTNLRHLYWNCLQMLAHATINNARFRPGDLFASGTVSGPASDALGCMLEITRNGKQPLALPGGEARGYLEDGDRVTLRGWCQGQGYRVGFGECTGRVLSAS